MAWFSISFTVLLWFWLCLKNLAGTCGNDKNTLIFFNVAPFDSLPVQFSPRPGKGGLHRTHGTWCSTMKQFQKQNISVVSKVLLMYCLISLLMVASYFQTAYLMLVNAEAGKVLGGISVLKTLGHLCQNIFSVWCWNWRKTFIFQTAIKHKTYSVLHQFPHR